MYDGGRVVCFELAKYFCEFSYDAQGFAFGEFPAGVDVRLNGWGADVLLYEEAFASFVVHDCMVEFGDAVDREALKDFGFSLEELIAFERFDL